MKNLNFRKELIINASLDTGVYCRVKNMPKRFSEKKNLQKKKDSHSDQNKVYEFLGYEKADKINIKYVN